MGLRYVTKIGYTMCMEQQKVAEMIEQAVSPEVACPAVAAKKRGRPAKYASAAERQAAYRARKGGQSVALIVPDDVAEGIREYLKRQHMDVNPDMTMSDVIVKLVRQQLMRKR